MLERFACSMNLGAVLSGLTMVPTDPMKNRGHRNLTLPGGTSGPLSGARSRQRAHQRPPGGQVCHRAWLGTA